MPELFRKTKAIETEFDQFLDLFIEGGLLFKQGLKFYLSGQISDFEERLAALDQCEGNADELRRSLESKLYMQTLIPEYRGDVLRILESSDHVLNAIAHILLGFSIERPEILEALRDSYLELAEQSINAMDSMVAAIRAYFMDLTAVRDHVSKARFYEHESDRIAEKILRAVFAADIELSRKLHMRHFALQIEHIGDAAEDICDNVSIAAIKRYI